MTSELERAYDYAVEAGANLAGEMRRMNQARDAADRRLSRILWAGEQLYDALTDPDKSSDEQLAAMARWNRATDGLRRVDYREGPGQPDVYCDVCGKHGHARCGMKEARAELEDPRTLKASA